MTRAMTRRDTWAVRRATPAPSLGSLAPAATTMLAAKTKLATTTAAAVTLDVDRIRCDGYGMCAELLPELIELDDWGYPIVRPGGVPDDLRALARRAVDVCPVLALKLRRVLPRY